MKSKTIKAIIVDNSTFDSEELKQHLLNSNFNCSIYTSYRQATKILENDHSIDLVISDLFAGGNHGMNLARMIKQSPRLKYIPVILMSNQWDNNTIIECARIGVNALVARPFSIEDMMTKIGDALTNGKRKVLIIDDDREVLNLLRQVVELERFDTLTAESAEAGVQILDDARIDAVISDVLLPGMSGVEFLKMNKNSHPNIPVILITGYAGRFDSKAANEAGADGFFQKPFNNIELIRCLRNVIDNKVKSTANS